VGHRRLRWRWEDLARAGVFNTPAFATILRYKQHFASNLVKSPFLDYHFSGVSHKEE
jgi:hypothetical protein